MNSRQKVPFDDYDDITERAKSETLTAIAEDYGVTRERIRQIVKLQGGESKYAARRRKRSELCLERAEEILYYREAWLAIRWKSLGLLKPYFIKWLSVHGDDYPDYVDRWVAARDNYRSSSGKICVDGRVCAYCYIWKPWDEFYKHKDGANEHSNGCIECSLASVKHYLSLKNVQVPTVTEKVCPLCGVLKSRSAYSRATQRSDGLQTYCTPCQRTFPSARKNYKRK